MANESDPQPRQQEAPERDDYALAYAIVEQMGLGFEFRNCSCGQLPCARLRPIVDALAKREAEVRAVPRATAEAELTVESALKELREMYGRHQRPSFKVQQCEVVRQDGIIRQ